MRYQTTTVCNGSCRDFCSTGRRSWRHPSPNGIELSVTLGTVNAPKTDTVVEEVLRFEHLPFGSPGTRRAVVRWSDGSESSPVSWYPDEILICEGDFVGKTLQQLRFLHFQRDRDWLQS
jgi:hypothetical protein